MTALLEWRKNQEEKTPEEIDLDKRKQDIESVIAEKQKQNELEAVIDIQTKKVYVRNKLTGEQTDDSVKIFKWLNLMEN